MTWHDYSTAAVSSLSVNIRALFHKLAGLGFHAFLQRFLLGHTLFRGEAMRAVGRANGDDRMAIVIPCHRVVGSKGELTGYGGGLWRKKYLLSLEQSESFSLS